MSLGACGTIATRGSVPVGAYPFASVEFDVVLIGALFDSSVEKSTRDRDAGAGLLSLPVDLAIDAVLLPIDLVAWIFGARKSLPC